MLLLLLISILILMSILWLGQALEQEDNEPLARNMGGKCIAKYMIVLLLLTDPVPSCYGSMMDPIDRNEQRCRMIWQEKMGCAGGKNVEEKCDKYEFKTEQYIWPPNSTKLCDNTRDWVVLGEIYCLRNPYGNEMKECLGDPKPLIATRYTHCCPVTIL
nr:MAG: hypothetical protein [Feral pigeon parvovirus A]